MKNRQKSGPKLFFEGYTVDPPWYGHFENNKIRVQIQSGTLQFVFPSRIIEYQNSDFVSAHATGITVRALYSNEVRTLIYDDPVEENESQCPVFCSTQA